MQLQDSHLVSLVLLHFLQLPITVLFLLSEKLNYSPHIKWLLRIKGRLRLFSRNWTKTHIFRIWDGSKVRIIFKEVTGGIMGPIISGWILWVSWISVMAPKAIHGTVWPNTRYSSVIGLTWRAVTGVIVTLGASCS